ncbi:hypothetical protein Q8W71_24210 [Methylobacterium sp. NEAU 140]|uniref:hypothetical protein n=1 Tax=Methylobacterium sp. NEAU 140 TaxID=3064945 RepID=UPI002734AE8D|nr:hypothetical protein [Methylobacterium sp. NEAU 140]MDP4025740.1 hypothetical protein [Methylobacterium sp. NEAU 140]
MAQLIDLLGDMPSDRNRQRAVEVGDHLDCLDAEARRDGAPATTLAAIKGARVLLELSEMPPLGSVQTRQA